MPKSKITRLPEAITADQLIELVKAAVSSKTNEIELVTARAIERMMNPPSMVTNMLREGINAEPGGITFVNQEDMP